MIIDNRGKLFGKVSVVDILIILFLVLAAGLGYRYMNSRGGTTVAAQPQKIIMVFYGEEAPEFAVKAAKKGDVVREYQGSIFGKVIEDIKIDKARKFDEDQDGNLVPMSREGYVSYFMTVEGEGFINSTGVSLGGTEYQTGKLLTIKVGNAIFQGMLYSFEKKG